MDIGSCQRGVDAHFALLVSAEDEAAAELVVECSQRNIPPGVRPCGEAAAQTVALEIGIETQHRLFIDVVLKAEAEALDGVIQIDISIGAVALFHLVDSQDFVLHVDAPRRLDTAAEFPPIAFGFVVLLLCDDRQYRAQQQDGKK